MARVLVVEPDRRIREFIAGILSDFGHQVHLSDDPGEARLLVRQYGFDAVIADQADKPFRLAELRALAAAVAASGPAYALAA